MSNQKYFDVPFGFSGDVTAIPDPLQVGGSVSFTEGWNFNYQRDLATDPAALPIDRSTMNWLLLQITTALPEWILASQNAGVAISYGLGSVVLYSTSGNAPFTKFVSLVAANVATPSTADPLGATTGWQVVCDPIATAAQASAGTNNASIMTPLLVAQQTALRALLAGSGSQVFNVGSAVAATQAPQLQQVVPLAGGVTMTGALGVIPAVSSGQAAQFGQVSGIAGQTLNFFSNVAAASATKVVTADEIIVETALGGLRYCLSGFNKTGNLGTVGPNGMDTGVAGTNFVAEYVIYNPNAALSSTNPALLYATTTGAVAPAIYGGAHMPAGYTASGLVGVLATGGGNFTVGCQRGRTRWCVSGLALNVAANQFAPTAFNIGTDTSGNLLTPMNAKTWLGTYNLGSSVITNTTATIAANAVPIGVTGINGVIPSPGESIAGPLLETPIITAQTAYYTVSVGAGTPQFSVNISGYTI